MKHLLLMLLPFTWLASCTTTHTLESREEKQNLNGMEIPVLYEKLQYKTSVRSGESIFDRKQVFSFGFEVSIQEPREKIPVFTLGIQEKEDLDALCKKVTFRPIKKKNLLVLGYKDQIVGAVFFIEKHPIVAFKTDGYSNQTPFELFGTSSMKKIVVNDLPSAKTYFKAEIEKGNTMDGKTLEILLDIPSKDPIHLTAAVHVLSNPDFSVSEQQQSNLDAYVHKMKGNRTWVDNALKSLFSTENAKIDLDMVYVLGGMKVVDSLDIVNTQRLSGLEVVNYIQQRIEDKGAPISTNGKQQFKGTLEAILGNPCSAFGDRDIPIRSIAVYRQLGYGGGDILFVNQLKKSKCAKKILVALGDGIQWNQELLNNSERTLLIDYICQNLGVLGAFDQRWVYHSIDDFLTPNQHQKLLTEYPALNE